MISIWKIGIHILSLALLLSAVHAETNKVILENQKPGSPSTEWDVNGAGDPTIQGFATDISVNVGDTVHFKIKSESSAYRCDIYRLGYYNGDGARLQATIRPQVDLPQVQPECFYEEET